MNLYTKREELRKQGIEIDLLTTNDRRYYFIIKVFVHDLYSQSHPSPVTFNSPDLCLREAINEAHAVLHMLTDSNIVTNSENKFSKL